ncbi:unnamed protein product [Moneuplotes crassus]|uniref:MORN repeat protein n=1 Tax=Euplotes crassus TaxID=5936 RepID=A0AAD1XS85_EUPCR|nr:unnamed protein product [Moneuplotes crassus]
MEGVERFNFLAQKSFRFDLSQEEYLELKELLKIEDNFWVYYPQAMGVMTEMMSESVFKIYASLQKPSIKYLSSPGLEFVPITKHDHWDSFYFGQKNRKTCAKEGVGIEINSQGQVCHGTFINGLANGKGTLITSSDLSYYNGEFVDNCFEGTGTFVLNSGYRYEGQWRTGKRNGFGIEIYPNGDVYEGDFVDNKNEGYGKLACSSGYICEGQWEDNALNGYSSVSWSHGMEYFGNYKNGKNYGIGNLTKPDGRSLSGKWAQSKCEEGIYSDTKGREYKIPYEISSEKAMSMLKSK